MTGTVKWFRSDKVGYIIPDIAPKESVYFDVSSLSCNCPLDKGMRVSFKTKTILGEQVAVDVQIIGNMNSKLGF